MHNVSEIQVQDASDEQKIQEVVASLVDTLFLHLGDSEWDGAQPTHAGICAEAFSALTGRIEDLECGRIEEDSDLVKAAGHRCSEVLQAGVRV